LPEPLHQPHPASLPDDELLAQCTLTRGRTGGPGGQHRNKVETAVTLVHTPTGVKATAGERRSVRENKPVAIKRLRLNLAKEIRMPVPSGEIRSDLWRTRCQKRRIICNPKHRDYPSLLAEALDVIEACSYDMPKAALRLECSATQLCKLIQNHTPAWTALNKTRESLGLRVLR
jgi:RF-1 domain